MTVTAIEPYVGWEELSKVLSGRSKRWLASRVAEGMPSVLIGGRRAFRLSEALRWLEEKGHIERTT